MPIDPTRIRAIIFDLDGTLSDTDDRWVKRITRWLMPFAFLFPEAQVQPAARRLVMAMDAPGNAYFSLVDRLHLDAPLQRLADLFKRGRKSPRGEEFSLIPGTVEMLEALSRHYPLAIFTARDSASTQAFIHHFHLKRYFRVVATALTCTHTKPQPDAIFWIAEQLVLQPAQCLMVGDTVVDIQAGKAAEAQTAAVLCGFGSVDELQSAHPDQILAAPCDLVHWLTSSTGASNPLTDQFSPTV